MLRRQVARLLVVIVASSTAQAQGITRDNYHAMIPPKPRIVGQTGASVALHLFGDPSDSGYRDVNPVDGIDDRRAPRLLELAARFSPILRRNNASVPRDPADVSGPDPLLYVDSWDGGHRVRSDSLALGPRVLLASSGDRGAVGVENDADRRLRTLFAELGPRARRMAIMNPDSDVDRVLFFDMPGHDPPTWRAANERLGPEFTRVFAHPFIHEERGATDSARYQIVVQYWFFYPFNNSVNNHEGDWEHINVIVTTRARAASARPREYTATLLTPDDMSRILDSSVPLDDSTVIAAVDYYFHDHVLTLDYIARRMVPQADDEQLHDHGPRHVWEDRTLVSRAIDSRTTVAGGRLATHALVYVGGNSKGPDELLSLKPSFRRSLRRDSHGSYPFPGTWQTIGPLGMTEQVFGEIVPPLRDDTEGPWYSSISDPYYVVYPAEKITVMPDWEGLEPLVSVNSDVRRKWAWMLLPIYWGFPAVASLGAGMMHHVDMGNIAPLSPTYHSTWNHVGTSARHSRFSIRVLRTPLSPTTPWAVLRNGWGILNVPLAAWGLMPGYNVAVMELMPWIGGGMHILRTPPSRTFTSAALPHRFTAEGQGAFWEFGGKDFAAMLPRNDSANAALGARVDERSLWRNARPAPRIAFNLFFHDKFAMENTYSWQQSTIGYYLIDPQGTRVGSVSGALEMRQLTGGVRYSPYSAFDQAVQVHWRGGYGWLSYEASDVRLNNASLTAPPRGGYLPPILPSRHWWPNTWYTGGGIEAVTPRKAWLFDRIGYGVRIDASLYANKLKFDNSSGHGDVVAIRRDLAASLIFGW